MDSTLSRVYYSPRGYWWGEAAVKKLAAAAKAPPDVAGAWLERQAIWQIYLPTPRHIPRPKFDVGMPNEVHQADLLFLPHDKVEPVGLNIFLFIKKAIGEQVTLY